MLEEKVETLTTEIVALRKVMEAALPGLTAGGAAADAEEETPAKKTPAKKPAAKKAPAKKAPAKKKVEPKHDEDEVAAIMRQAAKEVDKQAVMDYISEQGCDDLADLLTKPELFDAAYAFAEEQLGGDDEEEEEDDI